MVTQDDRFLQFVRHNLTMVVACSVPRLHEDYIAHGESCPHCSSTPVPRPEAVELWEALTEVCTVFACQNGTVTRHPPGGARRGIKQVIEPYRCGICKGIGRVPRSPTEQHVALETWLVSSGWSFQHLVWNNKSLTVYKTNTTLQEAAKDALVASGWTVLEKEAGVYDNPK